MGKRINLAGRSFGYLKATELTAKIPKVRSRKWIVDCSACGQTAEIESKVLLAGSITSCGCRTHLTMRGFVLIKRMRTSNQRLCKSLPNSESQSPETRFFLEPSGKVVRRDAAESAIAAKELVPLNDGLFADTAQTWVTP